jgi:hypothetical protein
VPQTTYLASGVSDYPPVQVTDSTNYTCTGEINYLSVFCSNDQYVVDAGHTFTGPDRGVCLVDKITATVQTANGDVEATPYTSSGTSYSQYAIVQIGSDSFQVIRITGDSETMSAGTNA